MNPETRSPVRSVILIGLLTGVIDWGVMLGGVALAGRDAAFPIIGFVLGPVAAVVVLEIAFRKAPVNVAPLAVTVGLTVPFALWGGFWAEIDTFTLVFETIIFFVVVAVLLAILAGLTRIIARFWRPRR